MLSPLKALVYFAIATVAAALPAEEASIQERQSLPDFSTLLDNSVKFLGLTGTNVYAAMHPIVSAQLYIPPPFVREYSPVPRTAPFALPRLRHSLRALLI